MKRAVGLIFAAIFASGCAFSQPAAPGIAGYVIECGNTQMARSRIEMADLTTRDLGNGRFVVAAPAAIGGILSFGLIGRALPDLS